MNTDYLAIAQQLGEAIATKDYAAAARHWEALAPIRESLCASNPLLVHVGTVLRNEHAMLLMAERLSNAIH